MDETIIKCNISGRRFFKRHAKKVLYNDWLCQIFAFFIVSATAAGINLFGNSIFSVLLLVTENELLAATMLLVYQLVGNVGVLVPLLYGVVYFEKMATERKKAELSDLFYSFSSATRLCRAYYIFINVLLRVVLCFLPAIVLSNVKFFFYYEGVFGFIMRYGNIDIVATGIRIVIAALVFVGFVLSSKYYVVMYLSIEKENADFSMLVMTAKMCAFGERIKIYTIALSFLPLCVLSLFSMGFLFILFTFPYMLLTFSSFCKYIYEKELYTKSVLSLMKDENKEEI